MATGMKPPPLTPPVFDVPTRVLIVVSPYYQDIAAQLLSGAEAALSAAARAMYERAEVPGALEIPTTIALAARSGAFDGYVALGCVMRGETTHYETVCNDSSRGLMQLGLAGHCIGNGILTVENRDQAAVRADATGQNKGGGAAEAALHLIALARRFRRSPPDLPQELQDEIRLAGGHGGSAVG